MKNNKIIKVVSTAVNKTTFTLKKYSPEILITAGVIGTVVSTVLACKATIKISDVLEETREDIDTIHRCSDDEELSEDTKKALATVYAQTALKVVKLYTPSVVLGTLSMSAIITSNNILRERNIALAAAYTTVDRSFKNYRNRVIDRFGQEVERELRYDIKAKEVEEIITDEKTGMEKTVKKTVKVAGVDGYSEYARFFDADNPYWEKSGDYNFMFLKGQQNYWNDKLVIEGRVFLNDVYESIGIPRTKAGQIVGWVYDKNNTNIDNYIDFGMFNMHREANRNFIEGYEPTILLDFNVDGNVWDRMSD